MLVLASLLTLSRTLLASTFTSSSSVAVIGCFGETAPATAIDLSDFADVCRDMAGEITSSLSLSLTSRLLVGGSSGTTGLLLSLDSICIEARDRSDSKTVSWSGAAYSGAVLIPGSILFVGDVADLMLPVPTLSAITGSETDAFLLLPFSSMLSGSSGCGELTGVIAFLSIISVLRPAAVRSTSTSTSTVEQVPVGPEVVPV